MSVHIIVSEHGSHCHARLGMEYTFANRLVYFAGIQLPDRRTQLQSCEPCDLNRMFILRIAGKSGSIYPPRGVLPLCGEVNGLAFEKHCIPPAASEKYHEEGGQSQRPSRGKFSFDYSS